MTAFLVLKKKGRRSSSSASAGQSCFFLLSVFCLALVLWNAEDTIASLQSALLACGRSVIPSLFPMAVLSELLFASGRGFFSSPLLMPLRKLFRLPSQGCWALLLGWICGFPIGARCIRNAYLAGQLEKSDAERALAFCNIPSPAFLINAVGLSLYESRELGIALYGSILAAALLCGMVVTHLPKKKEEAIQEKPAPHSERPLSAARLWTEAVRNACGSILLVCAYVLFFSAFSGAFRPILSASGLPEPTRAILLSILEISVGTRECSGLSNRPLSVLIAAFAAGWSGFSVHCQLLSVCDDAALSFRPYVLSKALQGPLSALFMGALLALFPSLLP